MIDGKQKPIVYQGRNAMPFAIFFFLNSGADFFKSRTISHSVNVADTVSDKVTCFIIFFIIIAQMCLLANESTESKGKVFLKILRFLSKPFARCKHVFSGWEHLFKRH